MSALILSTSISKLSTLVCTAAACGADVREDGPLAECFVDVPGHDVRPEEGRQGGEVDYHRHNLTSNLATCLEYLSFLH